MEWDFLIGLACVLLLPTLATDPRVARRIVFLPGAAWFTACAVLLATAGLALWLTGAVKPRLSIAYYAPLAQIALIQAAYRLFVRTQGREPVDTVFNWTPNLVPDRVYAFVVTLGGILPFFPAFAPPS